MFSAGSWGQWITPGGRNRGSASEEIGGCQRNRIPISPHFHAPVASKFDMNVLRESNGGCGFQFTLTAWELRRQTRPGR